VQKSVSGVVLAAGAALCAAPVVANSQDREFNIPEQPAGTAVSLLGRQAGIQIIAARSITHGKRTNAVIGGMPVDLAMERMLADTGLIARRSGPQTFVILETPPRTLGAVSHTIIKVQ